VIDPDTEGRIEGGVGGISVLDARIAEHGGDHPRANDPIEPRVSGDNPRIPRVKDDPFTLAELHWILRLIADRLHPMHVQNVVPLAAHDHSEGTILATVQPQRIVGKDLARRGLILAVPSTETVPVYVSRKSNPGGSSSSAFGISPGNALTMTHDDEVWCFTLTGSAQISYYAEIGFRNFDPGSQGMPGQPNRPGTPIFVGADHGDPTRIVTPTAPTSPWEVF
jgi:hypothetical protein